MEQFHWVDVYAIDYLLQKGVPVCISEACSGLFWCVECEWTVYLGAVWHALAVISRGSEGVEVLNKQRCVKVEFSGKVYEVQYGYRDKGIYYGSLAV